MKPKTNWRVSLIFSAAATAVMLVALVYLFTVGFKVAQHRFWKIMDVALVCLMVGAISRCGIAARTGAIARTNSDGCALASGS
jgi:hypothetical protein